MNQLGQPGRKLNDERNKEIGTGGLARTGANRVMIPALYPLSYTGIRARKRARKRRMARGGRFERPRGSRPGLGIKIRPLNQFAHPRKTEGRAKAGVDGYGPKPADLVATAFAGALAMERFHGCSPVQLWRSLGGSNSYFRCEKPFSWPLEEGSNFRKTGDSSKEKWSGRSGSNRRQPVWKTGTLPLSYARKTADCLTRRTVMARYRKMAEAIRFELMVPLRVRPFSKRVP